MDVWRSTLLINDECRAGRLWLQNPYRIHQRLLMAYPNGDAGRLLWRPDRKQGRTALIVQAERPADWVRGFESLPVLVDAEQRQVQPAFAAGEELRYRLRAAPTKAECVQRGRRSRRMWLGDPGEWCKRLERKAGMHGFQIKLTFVGGSEQIQPVRNKHEPPHTLLAVDFSGRLVVTDAEELAQAVVRGIGTGKAYGCGLLLPERTGQEG